MEGRGNVASLRKTKKNLQGYHHTYNQYDNHIDQCCYHEKQNPNHNYLFFVVDLMVGCLGAWVLGLLGSWLAGRFGGWRVWAHWCLDFFFFVACLFHSVET